MISLSASLPINARRFDVRHHCSTFVALSHATNWDDYSCFSGATRASGPTNQPLLYFGNPGEPHQWLPFTRSVVLRVVITP